MSEKPRLLDLFSGAGGAAAGYADAGFEVVGVDHVAQPHYPFRFYRGDALDVLTQLVEGTASWPHGEFDAIHASPPCQAHSTLKAVTRHIDHPDLVAATRDLLERTGLPYVIENVPGAPLIDPVTLCGSSLGLDVRRHRCFETNWGPPMVPGCAHGQQEPRFDVWEHGKWRKSPTVPVYGSGGRKAVEHWASAMDIDWMSRAELAQAIPPAFTELLGHQLMAHLEARAAA